MKYKKGKFLETLVRFIQESLKESDNIKVSENVRIKSIHGDSRQFDVVITSTINTLPIRIVIECKDESRKTSVSEIEAFKTKCDTIKNIHKKIFVSKKGFSKVAVNVANTFEIELYQLDELDSKIVNDWLEKSGLKRITASVSLRKRRIYFKDNCIPENMHNINFMIYQENDSEYQRSFEDFTSSYIKTHLNTLHQKAIELYTHYKNENINDEPTGSLLIEVIIEAKKEKLYLVASNKKYYIDSIINDVVFDFEEQILIPYSSNSYIQHSTQNSQVELMSFHDILGDKRVIMTRNNAEKNHTKMFVTLNDGKPIPVDKMPVFYIPEGLEITIKEPE